MRKYKEVGFSVTKVKVELVISQECKHNIFCLFIISAFESFVAKKNHLIISITELLIQ